MRSRRRQLSHSALSQHGEAVCRAFINNPLLSRQQHIALYIALHGEMETSLLMQRLQQQNKSIYLPALHPTHKQELLFIKTSPEQKLRLNRFAIPEPEYQSERCIKPAQLDIICMPLVAFDAHGNRLGMGGGFYDRSLAQLKQQPGKPLLIGLAHAFQEVEHIESQPWDIPLQAIITEQGYRLFSHSRSD